MFLDFVNLKTDIIAVRTFLSLWSSIYRLDMIFRVTQYFGTSCAQIRHSLGTT